MSNKVTNRLDTKTTIIFWLAIGSIISGVYLFHIGFTMLGSSLVWCSVMMWLTFGVLLIRNLESRRKIVK